MRGDRYTDLTIEPCRGETYNRPGKVAVYRHFTYPRGSVLAGRPGRAFEDEFETVEEAQAKYPKARVLGFSTHRPVAEQVAHLPDTEGDIY